VTVALQGEQGKPRPALVIQADAFGDLRAVTVLPITGMLVEVPLLRLDVAPNAANGLTQRSQVMIGKPQTPSRRKLGAVIGHLDDAKMVRVNRALALFLGIA
jgi:mRNA interferase MazF